MEIAARTLDKAAMNATNGKIIEAGGPDSRSLKEQSIVSNYSFALLVFTYRDIMKLVLTHTKRTRPIISLPFAIGKMQGLVLEQLPPNLFTLTRDQVRPCYDEWNFTHISAQILKVEQLKIDNVVNPNPSQDQVDLASLLREFTDEDITSAHDILPSYM